MSLRALRELEKAHGWRGRVVDLRGSCTRLTIMVEAV